MYPPNAHLYDQEALHGTYVRRQVFKDLQKLTKDFNADHLFDHEKSKTIILTNHSTFERDAARVVCVQFDRATAKVSFQNYSGGLKPVTEETMLDVKDMKVEEASKAIIKAMAEAEPLLGCHYRETERQNAEKRARESVHRPWLT